MNRLHAELHTRAELTGISGTTLAFSADGQRWAAGDGTHLHVGAGAALLGSTPIEGGTPRGAIEFSRDGRVLHWGGFTISIGDDGRVSAANALPSAISDALAATLPRNAAVEVTAVASDGDLIVIAGRARPPIGVGATSVPAIAALVAVTPQETKTLWQGPRSEGPSVLALHHGLLAAGGGRLLVIELKSGRLLLDEAHPHGAGTVNAMAWSNEGRLFTAGANGGVNEWDVKVGTLVGVAQAGQEPLRAVAVTRDYLATTGWDDQVHLFAMRSATHESLGTLSLTAHGEALAFSPDGHSLLVALGGIRGGLRFVELR